MTYRNLVTLQTYKLAGFDISNCCASNNNTQCSSACVENIPMWTFHCGHAADAELHCVDSENFL